MNFFKKLLSEEPSQTSHWQRDEDAPVCNGCHEPFTLSNRRHHCRNCGYVFCAKCSSRQCAVPMRNLHAKVRVCHDCYVSLTGRHITSARASEVPGDSRAPSTAPGPTSSPSGFQAHSTLPSSSAPETGAGAFPTTTSVLNNNSNGTNREQSSTPAAAATAEESNNEDEHGDATGSPETAGEYQHAYGAPAASENASVAIASEQTEKELLSRRWAQVRKDAQFVDILIQRVERVEVDTPVEYSRETEAITLQPEMSVAELARTLMPLPQPIESSARFLLDPVHPILLSDAKGRDDVTPADTAASSGDGVSRGEALRIQLAKQLHLVSSCV